MTKIPFWERPSRLITILKVAYNLKVILKELLKPLKLPWYTNFLINCKFEGMFSTEKTTIILNLVTSEITKVVISYKDDDVDESVDTEEQQRRIEDVFRDYKAVQNIS